MNQPAEDVPGLRFHDLRHACAAMLIAQGANVKEIQEQLGHSPAKVTADRYGHRFKSLAARLQDGLDALFQHSAGAVSDVSPPIVAV